MKYAILDIETTGLDREHSLILEVGALIVSGDKVIDKFSSFVSYKGEIPETIKRLTGITEEMVKDAPDVTEVIEKLNAFIKGLPVVSHNGFFFDYPILERFGVKINEKYDSMEFSFFALPANPKGYSMSVLSDFYGLPPVPHRALQDCEIEFEVIQQLRKSYASRPAKHRAFLKFLAQRFNWWWVNLLTGAEESVDITDLVEKFQPYRKPVGQDMLEMGTQAIDPKDVEALFSGRNETGSGNKIDDYSEDRPEQRKMASVITNAFNTKTHAVIEAGTGTGKSKAYLVPSVIFALKNDIPVVVSTHTKALQDQLFFKEVPHLRQMVGKDLRISVLKGKKNYVCLTKLREFIDEMVTESMQRSLYQFGKDDVSFTRQLGCMLLASWALVTTRGDWDELPYWFRERVPGRLEHDVCNTDELCTSGVCDFHDEGKCFLAKARLQAKDADVVIVNHAIVLSGIVPAKEEEEIVSEEDIQENTPSKKSFVHTVFPGEAKFLVFDEAHHLEDDATSAWEEILNRKTFDLLLKQIFGKGERRGAADLVESIVQQKQSERLTRLADSFYGVEDSLKLDISALFERILPALVKEPKNGYSEYTLFSELSKEDLKALVDTLTQIRDRLSTARTALDIFSKETDSDRIQKILSVRAKSIGVIVKSLGIIIDIKESFYVRYIERTPKTLEVKAAPLSVAPLLYERVYNNFSSVILTSATLTIDQNFTFFASRCGVNLIPKDRFSAHRFSSSFNYKEQCQFFVPKGISKTLGDDAHLEASAKFLTDAVVASGGGALILCTSFKQVDKLYEKLNTILSRKNIWVLKQIRGHSPTSVIRDFASDRDSVLIGTESLWQGVDVPGESLRALILVKIPYRMPFLPLIKARRAEIESKGQNSFASYYEPLAAMALKQGFGRLIRKKTDVGIAVMLEEKLLQKPMLLNSLPEGVTPKKVEIPEIITALEKLAQDMLPKPIVGS